MSPSRQLSRTAHVAGPAAAILTALAAVPAAQAQEPASQSKTQSALVQLSAVDAAAAETQWSVQVRVDEFRRSEQLAALAALRTARDHTGFDQVLTEFQTDFAEEARALEGLLAERGSTLVGRLAFGRAIAVVGLTPDLRAELSGRPDVVGIERARIQAPAMAKATDAAHHDSVGANVLQAGGQLVQGQGVTIAIIDTGIDADHAGSGRPHAAFFPGGNPALTTGAGIGGSRILSAEAGFTWGYTDPEDVHGHGTRVASIAAGARWNFVPDVAHSPARRADIRAFQIQGTPSGLASTFTMVPAFNAAAAHPDVLVCNMSYDGDPDASSVLNHTIDDVARSGVLVTLSAGNNGAGANYFHGAYNALSVGASDVDTQEPYDLPGFMTSAIGPRDDGRRYPDLLAVGEALTCADMDNEAGAIDSYGSSGGAALVAGSAALVRQAAPLATALETKAVLLNTLLDVQLGDPNGRGLGYLHTKNAVEAALALDWTTSTIATGTVEDHIGQWTAGEDVSLTLVWQRELAGVADLDLQVQGPLGQPIGFSNSDRDNAEQLRFVAPISGLYTIRVSGEYVVDPGSGGTQYVLAGVQGTPVVSPSPCFGTAPFVTQVVPPIVETAGPWSVFTLKGCNLNGTSSVSVGGVPASFVQKGAYQLQVSVPANTPLGSQPVDIVTPGGSHSALVQVGQGGPTLVANWPTIDVGLVSLGLESQPGDYYWLGTSPVLGASVLPGLVELGIGNNFSSLIFLESGILPPSGKRNFQYFWPQLPQGIYLYFQAAVLDGVALTAPLATTNIVNLIKF